MSYHVWSFMAFKPNDQCYGHIHGIVCSNDLILCRRVHLGMANNVAKGSFHFLWTKKVIFILWVPKMSFFVKKLPNICCKTTPQHFSKILDHLSCTNHQMVPYKTVSIHLPWNWQICGESVGTGSNLNYNYFIVCSLFFPKIIFRYKCIYFIREKLWVL